MVESQQQIAQESDKLQSRKRYDHLRSIEQQMNEVHLASKEAEGHPLEGYEHLSFQEKNNGKYFTTFPYPYMNGYLHLGKFQRVLALFTLMADYSRPYFLL